MSTSLCYYVIDGDKPTPHIDSTSRRIRRGLGTLMAGVVVATGFAVVMPSTAWADGNVGGFLSHLNSVRAAHGLAPLALTDELNAVAQGHTQKMAADGTIYHNPSLASQVSHWQTLGENVGMGSSVSAIDNAFDASPGHFANEVNTSYTQVGIGSVTVDGTVYVTLDFRRPMNTQAGPQSAAQAPRTTRSSDAATQAAAQAAAHAAAAQAVAIAAAAEQSARLTAELSTGTDPIARAMVFSAHVNAIAQTG